MWSCELTILWDFWHSKSSKYSCTPSFQFWTEISQPVEKSSLFFCLRLHYVAWRLYTIFLTNESTFHAFTAEFHNSIIYLAPRVRCHLRHRSLSIFLQPPLQPTSEFLFFLVNVLKIFLDIANAFPIVRHCYTVLDFPKSVILIPLVNIDFNVSS